MKKLLSLIAISLLAIPAFAQDDFGGFDTLNGADLEALFGGGGGGNRGNRGGRGNNNIPNPETMFLDLRDLLKAKKVPLSKDQEKNLRTLLDTETSSMRQSLEAQFGNRGNNNNNQNNQNRPNPIAELFKVVSKHNTELLTTMKADLAPDQVSVLAKAEKDKKVCTVMLDLVNPQQLENRGGRGNNNFDRGGFDRGGFDGGFDLGGGGFDRGGRRGNNNFADQIPDRQFCTSATSTTAERLAPVAQVLSKGKKPLTPDQEKKFSELIEAKLPEMEEEIRSTDPQIANLLNQLNNQNRNNNNNNPQQLRNNIVNTVLSQLGIPNNNNNNRGNRGGGNNNNNNNANNNQGRGNRGNNFNIQSEIQKKNEELLDKVAASLNADQQPVIKKLKYDQIKAKGGADRYRAILEEEGTPLTPEQYTQIQAIFNSQNQAVRQFADQLVQKELENAPQQPPAAQPEPQNRNQNNVNQNPLAQQIVAKVLPQVSVQRARLEKVTQDTILKLLTPPQVASYKLNSL